MLKDIKSAIKSGHGNAIIYAGAIGLLASDVLPTPSDAIYFKLEKGLRDKWEKGELTPKQYWQRKALYYYLPNIIWWSGVLAIIALTGKTYDQKAKIAFGLFSAGAVAGVLIRNVQQDEQEIKKAS